MRILIIHERYRQRGGEDHVFDNESALLAARGCEVHQHVINNAHIDERHGRLALAANAIWSVSARRDVRAAIRHCSPDLVHVHNTFPLLSPAIYSAIQAADVPVVQTLHNFRPLCLNGLLYRDGAPCEDCLPTAWKIRGVLRRCYRDSQPASAAVAAMNLFHHGVGTWRRHVDLFLALSNFARDRFIAGGLPAERIVVKPNTAPDPGRAAAAWDRPRSGAVFVGRLTPEKGILNLVRAWRGVGHGLTVIGDGPLLDMLRQEASDEVTLAGWLPAEEISTALSRAALLCLPSVCYEQFPLTAAEAMAHGVPVLASDRGALAEIVQPSVTGSLVPPDDAEAWRANATSLLGDPMRLEKMGRNARAWYEANLCPDIIMDRMLEYYAQAARRRQ